MKLLLIGLDALDFRLFSFGDSAAKYGYCWFADLIKKSNYGIARPDQNYAWTGPSWTSIYTGLKIENHGVIDIYGRENWKGSGSKSFSSMGRPCIWDYLNQAGLFCGVMNFPVTWPAPEIMGWFISGWWTELSYTPKIIKNCLEGYISDYLDVAFERAQAQEKIDEEGRVFDWVKAPDTLEEVFKRSMHVSFVKLDILLQLPPVDCLLVQFPTIDRVGHKTLGEADREHCFWMMKETVLHIESLVKVLTERYQPEFLAIISDHGWQLNMEKEWAGDIHSEFGTWLISGPTVAQGRRVDIWNYDFLPSLFEAMGLDVPEGIDGRSKIVLKEDETVMEERLKGWGYA